MALKTTLEQLESVQTAIASSENALEVGKGDKRLVRQRLDTLYGREERLLERYRNEQNTGGMAFNVGVHGRSY